MVIQWGAGRVLFTTWGAIIRGGATIQGNTVYQTSKCFLSLLHSWLLLGTKFLVSWPLFSQFLAINIAEMYLCSTPPMGEPKMCMISFYIPMKLRIEDTNLGYLTNEGYSQIVTLLADG